jgi:hypothetical protein
MKTQLLSPHVSTGQQAEIVSGALPNQNVDEFDEAAVISLVNHCVVAPTLVKRRLFDGYLVRPGAPASWQKECSTLDPWRGPSER